MFTGFSPDRRPTDTNETVVVVVASSDTRFIVSAASALSVRIQPNGSRYKRPRGYSDAVRSAAYRR